MASPVRFFFEKGGPSRYMSHLDLTRCMTRCIRRSGIPVWYTEGFNQHVYMTFALPLSLGQTGKYEIMDVKFVEDMPPQEAMSRLNACLPEGIKIWKVQMPVEKHTEIASADYETVIVCPSLSAEALALKLQSFLLKKEILVEKRTKTKQIKEFDVKPHIKSFFVEAKENVILKLTLPAGCTENINPSLILNAFFESEGIKPELCSVVRTAVYNGKGKLFK